MKFHIKDYPRPQFVRRNWENLNGLWDFAFDNFNIGEYQKWYNYFPESLKIRVPFTYETVLSGIHDETRHDNIGYCYTQVSDVQQEINEMMDMERSFKIDPEIIRKINIQ